MQKDEDGREREEAGGRSSGGEAEILRARLDWAAGLLPGTAGGTTKMMASMFMLLNGTTLW